ncbi:MAG: flagellin, partial [Nitrospirales bacterium]|nr:flagellin [Nitrospirales bacterium]
MAINDITLTAGMRSTLSSLQQTANLFDRTQTRLATGKKVNTALDDPINYFAAKGYMDRASDLNGLKDSMNEAIQTIKAADAGVTGLENLISQAKSLANSALATADTTTRASYATQFDEILDQIDALAGDSGYKGTNLLDNDDLSVIFNEDSTSTLSISGFSGDSSGLSISDATGSWASDANITAAIDDLDTAVETLRTNSQSMSANLSIVQTRLDFTSNMVNTLTKGAENLTLADMNEEGANLLMLQTRQQLSSTSLSLASQAAQS